MVKITGITDSSNQLRENNDPVNPLKKMTPFEGIITKLDQPLVGGAKPLGVVAAGALTIVGLINIPISIPGALIGMAIGGPLLAISGRGGFGVESFIQNLLIGGAIGGFPATIPFALALLILAK